MTEFRAPPPPPDLDWDPDMADSGDGEAPRINPKMIAVAVGLVLIGVLFGVLFFSPSPPPTECRGLTNVILNPDIRREEALPICGYVAETQPCVLYILNHKKTDKLAQDFFQEAANLMSRGVWAIEVVNPDYSKMKIPGAHFAVIKIPPMN